MRALLGLAVLLVLLGAVPHAAAIWHEVTGDETQTVTLLPRNWEAYNVSVPDNRTVSVQVTANASVDFYVFTWTQFQQYVTPGIPGYGYEFRKENATDFAYNVTVTGRIVLVDNTDISATGADPIGPVAYTITFTYRSPAPSTPGPWGFVLLGAAGVVAGVSLVYVLWRSRRTLPPQEPLAPLEPPAPPP